MPTSQARPGRLPEPELRLQDGLQLAVHSGAGAARHSRRPRAAGSRAAHELLVDELLVDELVPFQHEAAHELQPELRLEPGLQDGPAVVRELRFRELRFGPAHCGSWDHVVSRPPADAESATCHRIACAYPGAPGAHILGRLECINRPSRAVELQSVSNRIPGPPGPPFFAARGPNCGPIARILRGPFIHTPPHGGQRQ